MKKLLCALVALTFVLGVALPSSFAQSDRATLEKNRLKSEIKRLEEQRFNTSSSRPDYRQHIEWLDRSISKKKQQLSDLESNPEQYFYNQSVNQQNQRNDPGVAVSVGDGNVAVDSNGNVIPIVGGKRR